MLRAAIGFFVIAIIAVVFGANGVAGVSMDLGKTLLAVFLALAIISFIVSMITGRGSRSLSLAFLALIPLAGLSTHPVEAGDPSGKVLAPELSRRGQ